MDQPIKIDDIVSYAYLYKSQERTQIMAGNGIVVNIVPVDEGRRAVFLIRVTKSPVHYEGQLVSVRPQHVKKGL